MPAPLAPCLPRPLPLPLACRWTQWIFLQLFNKGLAYQAEVPVNWCPALGTGAQDGEGSRVSDAAGCCGPAALLAAWLHAGQPLCHSP